MAHRKSKHFKRKKNKNREGADKIVGPTPERLLKGDLRKTEDGVYCVDQYSFVDQIKSRKLFDEEPDTCEIYAALEWMLDLSERAGIQVCSSRLLNEFSMIKGHGTFDSSARDDWRKITGLMSEEARSNFITILFNHRKFYENHELMALLPLFKEVTEAVQRWRRIGV